MNVVQIPLLWEPVLDDELQDQGKGGYLRRGQQCLALEGACWLLKCLTIAQQVVVRYSTGIGSRFCGGQLWPLETVSWVLAVTGTKTSKRHEVRNEASRQCINQQYIKNHPGNQTRTNQTKAKYSTNDRAVGRLFLPQLNSYLILDIFHLA